MPRQKRPSFGVLIVAMLVLATVWMLMSYGGQIAEQVKRAFRTALFACLVVVFAGSGLGLALTIPRTPARAGAQATYQNGLPVGEDAPRTAPVPPRVLAAATVGQGTQVNVPILMYHDTPADFDNQLLHLERQGYTTITMDQLEAAMHGAQLPPKPVVITFDDGFANQVQAFEALQRHNMKATFYIITSGEASAWCIGAGRRYGDPLQPPEGCGDAYLTWDQIRTLDRSGIIEIEAHTANHRDLSSLSADDQRFEMLQSKTTLETFLGHPIRHLAYPYGAYNADSVRIARESGFETAVTTEPGTYQAAGSEFTLKRIRDPYSLY